jgi:hypothetical protein
MGDIIFAADTKLYKLLFIQSKVAEFTHIS